MRTNGRVGWLSVLALAALASCSPQDEQGAAPATGDKAPPVVRTMAQTCSEPRPQLCTQNYDPVCAQLAGGGVKTYANACTACADSAVAAYTPGACP